MSASQDMLPQLVQELVEVGCPAMAARLEELEATPQFFDYSPLALLQEIVAPEHEQKMTARYNGRVRRAGLAGVDASLDACQDSSERVYLPHGVDSSLRTMRFMRDGLNVCVLGASGSGKSYFAKALALQACHVGRVEHHQCGTLLSGLAELRDVSNSQYQKRLRAIGALDLLVLDDFLLQPVTASSELSILFDLLNRRSELGRSTIVCSQRNPQGWAGMLGGDTALADAVTTRATSAYTVVIELSRDA